MIEFDNKRLGLQDLNPSITEEILEHTSDHVVCTCIEESQYSRSLWPYFHAQTSAMVISTQHLLPGPSDTPALQYTDQKGGVFLVIVYGQRAHCKI